MAPVYVSLVAPDLRAWQARRSFRYPIPTRILSHIQGSSRNTGPGEIPTLREWTSLSAYSYSGTASTATYR
jgi:hypothetical protein